jgi:hypothetical protein
MKKLIYILSISFLLLQSCSSNDSIPKKINILDSDFTIKYEIKFSYPTKSSPASRNIIIYWTEDIIQNKLIEVEEDIPSGTATWTKIINAKLKVRPYRMGFKGHFLITLSNGGGTAISTIYVNDIPIDTQKSPIANAYWSIPIDLQYISSFLYF